MRNLLLCLSATLFLLAGCFKKDTECTDDDKSVATATEKQTIAAYISSNNIPATKDTSGIYYHIITPGSSNKPGPCSSVAMSYSGRTFVNSVPFDQSNNAAFALKALISGMKKGIPLIGSGGRIMIYIPPSLGYGASDVKDNTGKVLIPANSYLIFDVTLGAFN